MALRSTGAFTEAFNELNKDYEDDELDTCGEST